MVAVGRDLCGSSSPTPLPKQDHLQQAVEDLVQEGLEYLQRRRLYNLPGQPVPVLRHPQSEEILPQIVSVLLKESLFITKIKAREGVRDLESQLGSSLFAPCSLSLSQWQGLHCTSYCTNANRESALDQESVQSDTPSSSHITSSVSKLRGQFSSCTTNAKIKYLFQSLGERLCCDFFFPKHR